MPWRGSSAAIARLSPSKKPHREGSQADKRDHPMVAKASRQRKQFATSRALDHRPVA